MSEPAGRYNGQVVVITGSRRGIGRVLTTYFLAEGAHVFGLARRSSTVEHALYSHFELDIGDDQAVRTAFRAIARESSRLDILVNSAGSLTARHALLMPAENASEMVNTNILGTLFVSREAAKLMKRRRYGRIINIGSMAVALEPAGDSVYAATKAAAMTMSHILAKEVAGFGITCNTLGVTAFASDMLDELPGEAIANVIAELPLSRMATADDITNVIDFFASDRSAYVTAQTVFLGGVH